jgi:hypothetical protein
MKNLYIMKTKVCDNSKHPLRWRGLGGGFLLAAAFVFAGCGGDDDVPAPDVPPEPDLPIIYPVNSPYLLVTPTNIPTIQSAGTYGITVTSSVTWTATVNAESAAWCTVSPATGTGSGSVTMNVAEYLDAGIRSATITVASGTLTKTVAVTQQPQRDTPPYAASAQTWTFGNQTWSDAIRCPECNKETFERSSNLDPLCRSYTADGKTWYYYNFDYVYFNKSALCPSPWRVPAKEDFETLVGNTDNSTLINAWGYGGLAYKSFVTYMGSAFYWSSTEYIGSQVFYLTYSSGYGDLGVSVTYGEYGHQIRCVK